MNIEVSHITKKYKKKTILKDISFAAKEGECIGILGKNGCGKTTLLSILAGIQKKDSGSWEIKDTEEVNPFLEIGYVPQGCPFMDDLTALDNLKLWYNSSCSDLNEELNNGILKMLHVDEFTHKKVSSLSGGMKKRLSIGCAMANKPRILILDEPSASLDLECKEDIATYLTKYKQAGGIIIITSHEEHEINLCDTIYILKDGTLHKHDYKDIPNLLKEM